jgi:SPP1 gp7 family putative phage head morphogenesis protein
MSRYNFDSRFTASVKDIMRSLEQANRNIVKDLGTFMPPNIADPAQWLKRNAGGDVFMALRRKAMELPEPERSIWNARLDKPWWRAQITNKAALYNRIDMEGVTARKSIEKTLGDRLTGTARDSYRTQGASMGYSFSQPNIRQADAMAKRVLDTRFTGNLTKRHTAMVKEQLVGGIMSGKSVNDMAKQINADTGNAIWEAKRLVRTELTNASAQGQHRAFEDAGFTHYKFYAALDERTCPTCGELHGQVFRLDEAETGENFPPIHPNCRCTILPAEVEDDGTAKDDAKDKTEDDGIDKVLSGEQTFEEWQKEYAEKHGATWSEGGSERNVIGEMRFNVKVDGMKVTVEREGYDNRGTNGKDGDKMVLLNTSDGDVSYKPTPISAERAEEIRATVKSKHGIEVYGLEGMDEAAVNEIFEEIDLFFEEGNDDVKEHLPEIRFDDFTDPRLSKAGAYLDDDWFNPQDGNRLVLRYDRRLFANKSILDQAIARNPGMHVKGFLSRHITAHELMHAKVKVMFMQRYRGFYGMTKMEIDDAYAHYCMSETKRALDYIRKMCPHRFPLSMSDRDAARTISGYAGWYNDIASRAMETFAEGLLDFRLNTTKATPYSKSIYLQTGGKIDVGRLCL